MVFSIDPSDPLTVFGALALLIFLGFAGNLIFSKLRFNDTLILILVGVIVGPVLGLVDQEPMLALSFIIGPLALILILFDGGLALKFQELASGLGSAAMLGLIGFVATVAIIGGATSVLLDVSFATGMVLGAIMGGTSALVVLPSLEHMKVNPKTGTTLSLESALTDVLVVVVSFTMIAIVAAGSASVGDVESANATAGGISFDAQGISSKLLITFSMSIFMGLAAGFTWLLVYPKVSDKPFGYMLTLGFMFAMYVFVEWILADVSSGGGPLAVLAFGIILGNAAGLGNLGQRVGADFGRTMKRFQGEVSFLVRTFFFVFLGIIVDLDLLKDAKILGISLILLALMVAARYIAVMATTRRLVPRGDDLVLLVMMPRGLAAAVLAAEPAARGIAGTESFVALAFLLLVGTNLLSTFGGMYLEKKGGQPVPVAPPARSPRSPRASASSNGSAKRSAAPRASPAKKSTATAKSSAAKKSAPTRTASRAKKVPASSTQSALEGLGRKR